MHKPPATPEMRSPFTPEGIELTFDQDNSVTGDCLRNLRLASQLPSRNRNNLCEPYSPRRLIVGAVGKTVGTGLLG